MSVNIQKETGLKKVAGLTSDEVMTGATEESQGKSGLVPIPLSDDRNSFLRGDGKWIDPGFSDVISNINNTLEDVKEEARSRIEYYDSIAEIATQDAEDQINAAVESVKTDATEKISEIDTLSSEKKTEITTLADDKETEITNLADTLKESMTTLTNDKESEFSTLAQDQTDGFTTLVSTKTSEFTTLTEDKTSEFTTLVDGKESDFTTLAETKTQSFNDLAEQKENDFIDTYNTANSSFDTVIEDFQTKANEALDGEHITQNVNTEDGVHGLRYFDNSLQYKDGDEWNKVLSGGQVISDTEPSDTSLLWITLDGTMKYYNPSTETWTAVAATWG